MSAHKVFIGWLKLGTTGLQIRERLANMPAVEVVSIDPCLAQRPASQAEFDGASRCSDFVPARRCRTRIGGVD